MTKVTYIAAGAVGTMATLAMAAFVVLHASAVSVPQNITTADLSLFGLGLAGMLIAGESGR